MFFTCIFPGKCTVHLSSFLLCHIQLDCTFIITLKMKSYCFLMLMLIVPCMIAELCWVYGFFSVLSYEITAHLLARFLHLANPEIVDDLNKLDPLKRCFFFHFTLKLEKTPQRFMNTELGKKSLEFVDGLLLCRNGFNQMADIDVSPQGQSSILR